MKQWEIWAVDVAHDTHPCVVISPAARAENEDVEDLNLLQCSSQRAGRPARTHEILLDTEDGLDWETLCR